MRLLLLLPHPCSRRPFEVLSLSVQANKQHYEFVFADNVRKNIVPSIVGLYNFGKYVFTFRR